MATKIPVRNGFHSRSTLDGDEIVYIFKEGESWMMHYFGNGEDKKLTSREYLRYRPMNDPGATVQRMRQVAADMAHYLMRPVDPTSLEGEIDSD